MTLSDEDYAASVISGSAWNAGYEDDDGHDARQPVQPQDVPVSAGARAKQRDPGQKTLWDCLDSVPLQGFKRPSAHGRDKGMPSLKKAKVAPTRDERTTTGTGAAEGGSARARRGAVASMPPPLSTSLVLLA